MAQQHTIQVIAHIRSDFHTKFGIPRQSGLVDALRGVKCKAQRFEKNSGQGKGPPKP